MARYTVTIVVDQPSITSVESKLRKAFGISGISAADGIVWNAERIKSPSTRSERLAEAAGKADDARSIVEELQDEMEQWRDSIPENMQSGDKYSAVDECATALEELKSHLEDADFNSIDFPGMIG